MRRFHQPPLHSSLGRRSSIGGSSPFSTCSYTSGILPSPAPPLTRLSAPAFPVPAVCVLSAVLFFLPKAAPLPAEPWPPQPRCSRHQDRRFHQQYHHLSFSILYLSFLLFNEKPTLHHPSEKDYLVFISVSLVINIDLQNDPCKFLPHP